MEHGKCIIASEFAGIKDILTDNYDSILINPLDPNFSEKIANSIITLYLDKQLRDKLVNNVKISYKEKLSLENYTNNLLKLYKLI